MMKANKLIDFKFPYVVLISKFIEHFGVVVEGKLEEFTTLLNRVSTLNMHKMGFTKVGDRGRTRPNKTCKFNTQ